eukprot:7400400-Pyramimonas_sp.AAC.1
MLEYVRAIQQGTAPTLERRPSAELLAPKTQPLAVKFRHLIELYYDTVMVKVGLHAGDKPLLRGSATGEFNSPQKYSWVPEKYL